MMKGTARTYWHTSWATGQVFLAFALALAFTTTTAVEPNPADILLVKLEAANPLEQLHVGRQWASTSDEVPTAGISQAQDSANRSAAPEGDKFLADIVRARVWAPERVAGVLAELRLDSAAHLGRLDRAERSEMMAAVRGAGVALGDRNKLRLLAEGQPPVHVGLQGARRTQQDGQSESVTNKQLKNQAEGHAGTAQPSGGRASDGPGISSDSASFDHCF
jgi:hypothetical protein